MERCSNGSPFTVIYVSRSVTPQNDGPSRAAVVAMIHRIGKELVEGGILTLAELNYATRVEQDQYGLERFV